VFVQRFLRALKYFICTNLYHSWLNNKENYGGKVPASMEKLTQIDGVEGKTANVVLGSVFEIRRIVVDTHIKRLAGRLGLSH
jgi:endonuclease III